MFNYIYFKYKTSKCGEIILIVHQHLKKAGCLIVRITDDNALRFMRMLQTTSAVSLRTSILIRYDYNQAKRGYPTFHYAHH